MLLSLGPVLGGCGNGDQLSDDFIGSDAGSAPADTITSPPGTVATPQETLVGSSTDVTLEGLLCEPSADCAEGFVLNNVPWRVLRIELAPSAISEHTVAADEDLGVVVNEIVGFDPNDVLAAKVPGCPSQAWALGLRFEAGNERAALQQAQALCDVATDPRPDWNCEGGGSASWRSDHSQHFAFFDDYMAAIEAATSSSEHADRTSPLDAAKRDIYRLIEEACVQGGCVVRASLEIEDSDSAVVRLVLVQHPAGSAEHSATPYRLVLDHGIAGGSLWWLAELEQGATVYGPEVDAAVECCTEVLFDLEPGVTATTNP